MPNTFPKTHYSSGRLYSINSPTSILRYQHNLLFHRRISFTSLSLFYIMGNRNIIHRYKIHKYVRYLGISMEKNEIKDRLFDILNGTDNLPIQDIMVEDRNGLINVYLTDCTRFSARAEKCGIWNICEV